MRRVALLLEIRGPDLSAERLALRAAEALSKWMQRFVGQSGAGAQAMGCRSG